MYSGKSLRTHVRRGLRLLSLLALMLGVVLALRPDAALAHEGNASVIAYDVYVHTNPDSWMIGTLYSGQRFSKQGEQSGYAWDTPTETSGDAGGSRFPLYQPETIRVTTDLTVALHAT